MRKSNFRAIIKMCRKDQDFSYNDKAGNDKTVLSLSIIYPEVFLPNIKTVQDSINRHIQAQVNDFYQYASKDLYKQAIAAYKESQTRDFPFNPFDAVLQYEITYNLNCHLSLYRDQYEYTGGAHGITYRASDTWNLINGNNLPLSAFFPPGQDYRQILIREILKEADKQMQGDSGFLFQEYRDLIRKYFNEESYYLTPSGLAIYYQQYEVAPYAAGIVVFTIPYQTLKWYPSC